MSTLTVRTRPVPRNAALCRRPSLLILVRSLYPVSGTASGESAGSCCVLAPEQVGRKHRNVSRGRWTNKVGIAGARDEIRHARRVPSATKRDEALPSRTTHVVVVEGRVVVGALVVLLEPLRADQTSPSLSTRDRATSHSQRAPIVAKAGVGRGESPGEDRPGAELVRTRPTNPGDRLPVARYRATRSTTTPARGSWKPRGVVQGRETSG